MSKLTKEEFQAYLKQIRELAEGPLEEIQKEVEVTNKFPQEFYDLAIENNLYRCSLPEEYGGWGLNELEILQVQEEFSRGPGGMRMHLHYAMDLNWRILDDYGSPELKAEYMSKFQNKEVFTCFALTGATGGTGADLHTTAVKDGDSYVLNRERINLNDLVSDLLKRYGASVTLEYNESIIINADRTLTERMLENLIDNAVKHTDDKNGIKITLHKNRFIIENHCKNLNEKDLCRIFEPYQTLSNSGGNGLGLSIVKTICNLHNFKCSVSLENYVIKFIVNF